MALAVGKLIFIVMLIAILGLIVIYVIDIKDKGLKNMGKDELRETFIPLFIFVSFILLLIFT